MWVCRLGAAGLLFVVACHETSHGHVHHHEARHVDGATIVLELPEELGTPERPIVEFDHASHASALGQNSCLECHEPVKLSPRLRTKAPEGVSPRIKGMDDPEDLDDAMEAYHELCIGCHDRRGIEGEPSGPAACGECHVRRHGEAEPERLPLRFDYSLHQRHSRVEEDRCETCHHVYDEASKQLTHRPETEEACDSCHGEHDEDRRLSLENAAHTDCIGCHRDRRARGQDSGPETCDGCHGAEARGQFEQLDEITRIKRAQPDLRWIKADGATSNLVGFDHKSHESPSISSSCSSCHHHALKACRDCHTLDGNEVLGGGITLEQAFHKADSSRSCIGCHQRRIQNDGNCMSCHHAMEAGPTKSSCRICHNGPAPERAAAMAVETALRITPLVIPETSDDFPEEVVIDVLAQTYEPSKLPHREIVEAMDKVVRPSRLAVRFHGGQPVPCSGCHHESPEGTRPPPCRACHTDAARPPADMPALDSAYHRQCIGCHQQMGIDETGCTDCHEEAQGRVER